MRLPILLTLTLAACSSTPDAPAEDGTDLGLAIDTTDFVEVGPGIERSRELPIGAFLNEIGQRVQGWSRARFEGDAEEERLLGEVLEFETARRQGELIEQLETGPTRNRALAAVALGFAKRKTEYKNDFSTVEVDKGKISLGPLLAAIDDPEPEVAANALMGLGILARAETPLEPILVALTDSEFSSVRSNAAFALTGIIKQARVAADRSNTTLSEGQMTMVREACILALSDADFAARTQCSAVLGLVGDERSLPFLGDRLDDEVELVAQSAAVALARIGLDHPELKGRVARLMSGRLDRVRPSRRASVLAGLVLLAGRHMGDSTEVWQDWARRLPA